MDAGFWAVLVVIWAAFGAASATIARTRGRNPAAWFLIGVALGVVGLILAAVLPRTPQNEAALAARTGRGAGSPGSHGGPAVPGCPYCGGPLEAGATACRWCGRLLAQGPVLVPGSAAPYAMPLPPPPAVVAVARRVAEAGATLRDTPAGSAVAELPGGALVAVYERSGGWVRVADGEGGSGWLRESDLARRPGPAEPQPPAGE